MKKNIKASKPLSVFEANKATLKRWGEVWSSYAAVNLPVVAKLHGASVVEFPGKTLLAIGPGPSLNKALPWIKKLQGKVVMVCLQRALRQVLEAGIIPEVCVVIDAGEIIHKHLAGLDLSQITMCMDYAVHPGLYGLKAGQIITMDARNRELKWFYPFLSHVVYLPSGFTVASTACALGVLWKCARIMMVGIDLALKGGMRYGDERGDARTQKWVPAWPDGKGKKLPSQFDLALTHLWLRKLASDLRGKVMFIQCSEGGAYIQGWHHRTLKQMSRVLKDNHDFRTPFLELGPADDSHTRRMLLRDHPFEVEGRLLWASEFWPDE